MKRGRQQILYNFLPGKTFDHESGQLICKVTNFQATDDPERQLNKRYVLDRVAWLLNQWPEERRRGFPDTRQPERYILATPRAVNSEIFPLLFECTKRECRRAVAYRDVRHVHIVNPHLRCQHCNSPLLQLYHVLIHKCGNIQPFIIPSCPKHGRDHIWLNTRGSQKYSLFRWQCRLCSFECPIIYGNCGDCNLPEKQMRPIVHRAGASYYPQYRTLINLPGRDLARILDDPERSWLAIAAYLRLFEHGADNRLLDYVSNQQGQTADQESIATLERLIQSVPVAARSQLQSQLDLLRQGLAGLGGDRRTQLINRAKELITLQGHALEEAGSELLEFVRIDESLQITTLERLEQRARLEMPERFPLYHFRYPEELRGVGLTDVRLIGDFPVTTVIVGYVRDQREADNTIIRSFPRLQPNDPRTPLYTDTVETEALLFRLDLHRVIRWLTLNGLISEVMSFSEDEAAARAWILNRVQSVNSFQEIAENSPVTRAIYGLVHSFSHLVLRQAVILSGFDRTSLSEYLFPRALSFVLYSNNRAKFTIGGLYTLFEQTLHEHLRAVVDRGESCVYDPVCMEETSACHACMHLSEMSCEHFNRNLGRKYLFGRIELDGSEYIGYWDKRCAG